MALAQMAPFDPIAGSNRLVERLKINDLAIDREVICTGWHPFGSIMTNGRTENASFIRSIAEATHKLTPLLACSATRPFRNIYQIHCI